MNIDGLGLQALLAVSAFAMIVAYIFVQLILPRYFPDKPAKTPRIPRNLPGVRRRKMKEANANIICSLPIHDIPRKEAPLY